MGAFAEYALPIQGLKVGVHHFKYALDNTFFSHFEAAPIQECALEVGLELDKRSDMLVLTFTHEGWMAAECDRCTAAIRLPLEGEQMLYVKYSEELQEEDDEVVFITRDTAILNVAKYLYEFAVLALPITNTYDCENDPEPPCNREVLQVLQQSNQEDDAQPGPSGIWDALKDLKQ